VGARDKFYASIAERGKYFKTADELKQKLDKFQKCWASDAVNATVKVVFNFLFYFIILLFIIIIIIIYLYYVL
jgi:hypothetical protein